MFMCDFRTGSRRAGYATTIEYCSIVFEIFVFDIMPKNVPNYIVIYVFEEYCYPPTNKYQYTPKRYCLPRSTTRGVIGSRNTPTPDYIYIIYNEL